VRDSYGSVIFVERPPESVFRILPAIYSPIPSDRRTELQIRWRPLALRSRLFMLRRCPDVHLHPCGKFMRTSLARLLFVSWRSADCACICRLLRLRSTFLARRVDAAKATRF